MSKQNRESNIINKNNSAWVFVSGQSEPRHMSDIIFSAHILKKKGIPSDHIYIFDDHVATETAYDRLLYLKNRVFQLKDFEAKVSRIKSKFIAVIVTGHGDERGIPILENMQFIDRASPTSIPQALRKAPHLELGIVVLGQCYAGIYNYIDAYTEPKLVVMGATNLHNSLSLPLNLQTPILDLNNEVIVQDWTANIFLYYFTEYLDKSIDIDGDGKFTVMDAYKYAGFWSNKKLLDGKLDLLVAVDWPKISEDSKLAQEQMESKELLVFIKGRSLWQKLKTQLENLHLQQEPWILNANCARDLQIQL